MFHIFYGPFVFTSCMPTYKKILLFLLLLFWTGEIEGMVDQESRHHCSSPDSAVLEMRPCHLTSLNLSFLLCKMGMIITSCDLIKLCRASDSIIVLVTIDARNYFQ